MNIIYNKKGIALITIYIVIAVIMATATTFAYRSMSDYRFAQRENDELKAYYAAEAGLNAVTMDIYNQFLNSAAWINDNNLLAFYAWFGNPSDLAQQRRDTFTNNYPNFPVNGVIAGSQYTVILPSANANPIIPTADGVLLKLIAVGQSPHLGGTVRKVVTRTVAYEMKVSPIFNYAYFVNNFGWLWGGGITVNGDVRSNGNFSFNGNPRINGDKYASVNPDLGTAGTISGNSRSWDITDYNNHVSDRARPTNPTDPANPNTTVYAAGYDGASENFQHQEVLNMPYLGDLSAYKQLAAVNNGQITQGAAVIVDNVYDGNGPDGVSGTADDGCVVLVGTDANPITIDGPVVVEGDVIIRGTVTGQGTIYAGRNVHVIGDIVYDNPPQWPKPDSTPQATTATNSTRDFLGLACKGNVIIGDYTRNDWRSNCERYLKPPFTQGYETNASDVPLGYDSDGDPSNGYWFDGNYTVFDGGSKDDGSGGAENRRFYESSLSDDFMRSISAPSNQIRNIDGISYNNHAFSGKVGDFTINGSIVSRDEAIIYSGNITMNYDPRTFGTGMENIDIFLPRDLSLPEARVSQSG